MFTFHEDDDIKVFFATSLSEQYQLSDDDGIIIGGDKKGRAALTILNNFKQGHSYASDCYDNEILCQFKEDKHRPPEETSVSYPADELPTCGNFEIVSLEVWGFDNFSY